MDSINLLDDNVVCQQPEIGKDEKGLMLHSGA